MQRVSRRVASCKASSISDSLTQARCSLRESTAAMVSIEADHQWVAFLSPQWDMFGQLVQQQLVDLLSESAGTCACVRVCCGLREGNVFMSTHRRSRSYTSTNTASYLAVLWVNASYLADQQRRAQQCKIKQATMLSRPLFQRTGSRCLSEHTPRHSAKGLASLRYVTQPPVLLLQCL